MQNNFDTEMKAEIIVDIAGKILILISSGVCHFNKCRVGNFIKVNLN